MAIKFGTDGWRGIIAEDFTFENVRLCAQGTVDLLKAQGLADRGLVVGYDTRFASDRFAATVAEVAAASGVGTLLSDRPSPTPAVSFAVVSRGAGGGVAITASHNSAEWNGFKYKPDYGGSASAEVVADLERHIAAAAAAGVPDGMPLADAVESGAVELFDPTPDYLARVAGLVDVEAIRNAGLRVVTDAMYGAGAGYLPGLLGGGALEATEIRGERNPAFPGMAQPEPIEHNLAALVSAVRATGADVGLATDGDGDRLGVVDERGRYVTTLQAFALLCLHQLEVLGNRGPLVRSITTTGMVDRLGDIYGVPVFDTPVGFKHLGPVMMRENALIAGEESGGFAFRGHLPERDGILSGLMLLEMMVKTGKSVSELLDDLYARVGPHHYDRIDLPFDPANRAGVEQRIGAAPPTALGGRRVAQVDTRDGVRFVLEGGGWALIRFSGTEPLLRLYAEAESPEDVRALLSAARELVGA